MKKRILKHMLAFAVLAFLAIPAVTLADTTEGITRDNLGMNYVSSTTNLTEQDPLETVSKLINTAMLLLGIIAVGIVLLGGFKWMTAGGNDEKVSEAQKLMGSGLIGLVIILSAWGIAVFILSRVNIATGGDPLIN